jgi:CTP:molybdopterin cytidylyltransferase MocA
VEALDAVILAGGKSERLRGVVPPYHKPFVVVNGESLLVAAIRHARRQNARRIVVVTCPQIWEPLSQLVNTLPTSTYERIVLLRDTNGVGAALRAGAQAATAERLLVLMADNVHTDSDVDTVCRTLYGVGVRVVYTPEARRFTRFVNGRWVEDLETHSDEDFTEVWCGPLVVSRRHVLRLLLGESKIGPVLDQLVPASADLVRHPVKSSDIGTPEELTKFTGGRR